VKDVREDILARLVAVAGTVPNIRTVLRNHTDVIDEQMPAALVLDGDEDVVAGNDGSRPSGRPLLANMTPEIQIVEQSDAIGSDLTTFRRELMKRVLSDATLNGLTGSNGSISYAGCETSFGWQQKQYGRLQLRFTFKYPLQPNDL